MRFNLSLTACYDAAQRVIEKHALSAHFAHAYAINASSVSAALVMQQYKSFRLVDSPDESEFVIVDMVTSHQELENLFDAYPGQPVIALVNLEELDYDPWTPVSFPWTSDVNLPQVVENLLGCIGENPRREGLRETPHRVAKAWMQWCEGYGMDAGKILKVFEDGAEGSDEMVTVHDIPFYSHCEHHLAPIFGTVTISYIPNGKIVGLSKLSRLANMFARRLQVQERLTTQIADALVEHLAPLGVGVHVKARHLCMESRGICQQGHYTSTTALRGVMKDEADTRAEFVSRLT